MKKIFTLLLFICCALTGRSQLLYESFNYTADAALGLHTQSGGLWNRLNTGDSILVTSGSLNYNGLVAAAGNSITYGGAGADNWRQFTSQTTGTVYYSFLLNVSSLGTLNTTGGYFAGFIDNGTSNYNTRLFARLSGTSNYNIGINAGSVGTNTAWSAAVLDPGTTYLVVASLEVVAGASNDVAKVWVNPISLGTTEPTPDATSTNATATDPSSIQRFILRQDNTTNTPGALIFDELRVGTSWADVTPSTISGPFISAGGNITNLVTTTGVASAEAFYTLSASSLSPLADNITITPSAGLEVSLVSGGPYSTTPIVVPYTAGALANTIVYTRIVASASQGTFSGTITNSGGGATTATVTVNGGVVQNYFNTKANLGLTNVGTWSSTLNGAGTSPANFTNPYQYFNIVNQANVNYTGVWNVTGTDSKVIVGDGTASLTFEISPGSDSLTSATKVDVLNNALLTIYNNRVPSLNILSTGSTVNFNQAGLTTADTIKIPAISYYNLYLTSGLKYFTGNTTTVRGELLADGVQGMNGPRSSPFATINALGNVNFANLSSFDPLPLGDLGRVTLKMNGPGPTQELNGDGTEIRLFRLQRDSSSTNTILVGANTSLTLGNASSGGLQLSPAATTLSLGANTLNLIGAGFSTLGALGKISSMMGSINVLKSEGTTDAGVLRFNPGSVLTQFTLNLGPAVTRDSVTIADNVTAGLVNLVKGKIVMTAGDTLSASLMTAPTVQPYSFVDGAVRLTGTANLGFAVGKGNNFAPVGISDFGGTTQTYTVHYFNNGYGIYTIDPATLATYPAYQVSRLLYWNVTSNHPAPYNAVFGYTDAAAGIINPAALRMANFDNTDWSDRGGLPNPANTTMGGTVAVPALTVFGPFTFAATAGGIIPVRLSVFAAQKAGAVTRVSWTTEQEINSKEFAVERSTDGGRTWATVAVVTAAGNSSLKRQYSVVDNTPAKGVNLYRLRSVDADNRFTNSDIKAVLFGQFDAVLVTPNPASSFVNIYMSKNNNSISHIIVSDANGRLVEKISTADQMHQFNVSRYAKGMYVIKVIGTENISTQKVIIQ